MLLVPSSQAQGANFPSRQIRIVVPFAPGGQPDVVARALAEPLSRALGQPVVIENRAGGAAGLIGTDSVAKAAPDGHTLLLHSNAHVVAPSLVARMPYDPIGDFAAVAHNGRVPQVLVVNPRNVTATNMKQFMDFVKANPAKLNYASAGSGTSHHLAGELFKLQSNTFITHIPYRGAGTARQDLIAGHVDMMFDGLGSSAAHVRAGRIRALAVAAPARSAAIPDVPTTAEAGLPSYQVSTWYGIWGVKGTSKEILDRMHAEIVKAISTPALREIWKSQGSEPYTMPQADFAAFLTAEIRRWADVTRASGARLD
jgi:tripartite-type tricarboxylate transporter receptor subunit TctC